MKKGTILLVLVVLLFGALLATAVCADGNPSLEFDPDEWEVGCCSTTYTVTGEICNTGDEPKDVADDATFWWEETGTDFVEAIDFDGDFQGISGGECRDLTLNITMKPGWPDQPEGTEVKVWLYAEPTNREGHVAHVRLTIESHCHPTAATLATFTARPAYSAEWPLGTPWPWLVLGLVIMAVGSGLVLVLLRRKGELN